MITIKLPFQTSNENLNFIQKFQQQYSSIVRYCFNRYQENKTEKEIRHNLKETKLNNIELFDTWFVQSAIYDAKTLFEKNKDKKVIFGGKLNFFKNY